MNPYNQGFDAALTVIIIILVSISICGAWIYITGKLEKRQDKQMREFKE